MFVSITLTHQLLVDLIALCTVSTMMVTAIVVSLGAIVRCLTTPAKRSEEVIRISPEKATEIQEVLAGETPRQTQVCRNLSIDAEVQAAIAAHEASCYFPTREQAYQHLEIEAEVQGFLADYERKYPQSRR